jgi:hypothetical protein
MPDHKSSPVSLLRLDSIPIGVSWLPVEVTRAAVVFVSEPMTAGAEEAALAKTRNLRPQGQTFAESPQS